MDMIWNEKIRELKADDHFPCRKVIHLVIIYSNSIIL